MATAPVILRISRLSVRRAVEDALTNSGEAMAQALPVLKAARAVRDLHTAHEVPGGQFCRECGKRWPCRTAVILDGGAPDDV